MSIFISEDALFFDIHDYIQQHLDTKVGKFRCILVANNQCLKILNPSENILNSLTEGFIFCCEINQKILTPQIHVPLHIKDAKAERDIDYKTYPRLITMHEKMNLEEFKITLYSFARRFFNVPENLKENFGSKVDNLLAEFLEKNKDSEDELLLEYLKEEYYLLFNPKKAKLLNLNNLLSDEARKQLIEVFPVKFFLYDKRTETKTILLNNDYYFKTSESDSATNPAEIGDNSSVYIEKQITEKLENLKIKNHKETYLFDSECNSIQIENYLISLKNNELILTMEIDLDLLDVISKKALTACRSIALQEKTKQLNINDCLNHFKLTEKLDKNNEWYCSVCKKHQKAYKKLELYYIPKNLILHLKRFEYSSAGKYRTYAEKIGSVIDFPLQDLDFNNFVIGKHNDKKTEYDLYAVSQHYGGVGGGHYTASCRNNGKWYDFNDSSVNVTNENSVVSSSAYMLFYSRKDC